MLFQILIFYPIKLINYARLILPRDLRWRSMNEAFETVALKAVSHGEHLWRRTNLNNCSINAICNQLLPIHYIVNEVFLHRPSLSVPKSSACPTGKMVLTKIPMLPLGESMPPTTLNPSPFFPGPFSNSTVAICIDSDLGRRGMRLPLCCWAYT